MHISCVFEIFLNFLLKSDKQFTIQSLFHSNRCIGTNVMLRWTQRLKIVFGRKCTYYAYRNTQWMGPSVGAAYHFDKGFVLRPWYYVSLLFCCQLKWHLTVCAMFSISNWMIGPIWTLLSCIFQNEHWELEFSFTGRYAELLCWLYFVIFMF